MTHSNHDGLPGPPRPSHRRNPLGVVAATCALALAASLVGQYGLGLDPCPACLLQRLLFALGLLASGPWLLVRRASPVFGLGALLSLALAGAGIAAAGYHLALLAGLAGESCSIAIPMALGQLWERLPVALQPLLEGYGSCTPPHGSAEHLTALALAACALALYVVNLMAAARGLRMTARRMRAR